MVADRSLDLSVLRAAQQRPHAGLNFVHAFKYNKMAFSSKFHVLSKRDKWSGKKIMARPQVFYGPAIGKNDNRGELVTNAKVDDEVRFKAPEKASRTARDCSDRILSLIWSR
jgi:hypothetical protein